MALSLALLCTVSVSAQTIDAQFSTEKTKYLVGEPLFVTLVVSNQTSQSIWLEFQSPDMAQFLCDNFAVEVPNANPAQEQWGCGFAGSCGRSYREALPGKSITLRQLVNHQFRLQARAYALHAHTNIVVHEQNVFDSPEIEEVNVSHTLQVEVQSGNENQLQSAFEPIVRELDDSNQERRTEAAAAIIELAPPFLEDVLIELTKSDSAYSAIAALRKANTPKTRAALAQIASGRDDSILHIEAINNLGRSKDIAYLPMLVQLMESEDKLIQNAAAEAAGVLGGATAVGRLSTLVLSQNAEMRIAGVNGLGNSTAREAVPILIGRLLDADSNVRQAAVTALWLLTQHAAFDGNEWADISIAESAAIVHRRWVRWWGSHGTSCEIHGMADCSSPQPLDVGPD